MISLTAEWGFSERDVVEMTTAMAVGTVARPFGSVRPIFPSLQVKARPKKASVAETPWAGNGRLNEAKDEDDFPSLGPDPYDYPANYINYTDIPYHLQVMDHVEGLGWGHVGDDAKHSVFHHENLPGYEVKVARKDVHPIWTVSGGISATGSDVGILHKVLSSLHPPEE